MIGFLLAWLRKTKPSPPQPEEDGDLTPELKGEIRQAMQKHVSSSRLIQLQASRSAKAVQALNELLALQASAKEGLRAADLALNELDRARHAKDDRS
jgi:hypothetical protein